MSDTQERLEQILRVMYVTAIQDADGTRAGRKGYRMRHDEVPEAYAKEIMQLIESAKREWARKELEKIHTFHDGQFMNIEERIAQLKQSEESE